MKIAVFGVTGKTGERVIELALSRGDHVVAMARDPDRVKTKHPKLEVLKGDPTNSLDVSRCVVGSDAVIHCLGIGGKGNGQVTTLISDSVKTVISALQRQQGTRLVCMSNVGAGGSGTWFANRLVIPLFLRWLRPIIDDKDRMEQALRESSLNWVSVRLPMIVEGSAKKIRVSSDGKDIGLSITDSSVAEFLLEQAKELSFRNQTPSISN